MFSVSNRTYTFSEKRDPALKNSICRGMNFTAVKTDLDTLAQYINDGYAYTHVFSENRRLKDNFLYTSLISIDIDDCPINMDNAIDQVEKKPTFAHYTASNGYKGYGYRFRFIYVFEDLINREHYTPLVCAISDYLKNNVEGFDNSDDCSKVLNQFYFGSDCSETTLVNNGITYRLSDFPHEPIPATLTNTMVMEGSMARSGMPNNDFFNDFKTMQPTDFLNKYRYEYKVQDHSTPIDYKYGAVIYDKDEYMEIYRPWERYEAVDGKTRTKIKVYEDGENRRKHLYADAIMFRKIYSSITLEELTYALMNEIYSVGKYDNSDNQLDVYGIADSVINLPMDKIESFEYKGKRKGYKVDKNYCYENGLKPNSYSKQVRKKLKMDKVIPLYDSNLTYKQNVERMKKEGVKISIKTLKRYLDDYFLKRDNENNINNNTHTIISQCPIAEKTKKRKGSITDEELEEVYDTAISLKENLTILNDSGVKVGKDRLYKYCKKYSINTNPNKKKE